VAAKPSPTTAKPAPAKPEVGSAEPLQPKADSPSVRPAALLSKSEPATPETTVAKLEKRIRRERIHSNGKAAAEPDSAPPTKSEKAEKHEQVAKAGPAGADDEFDREFGGNSKKSNGANKTERRASVYIPPAPGSEIPDSLGPGEIMQVVVANKPSILKCAAEQKKKDATMAGKIVMRWGILPTGKTTNVTCISDQFKSSYMAQCIGGLIKGWQFPRHKVAGEPIDFPFTF
jgi:hypothetical protein